MEVNKRVIELSLDDVLPNRFQPRIKFNEEAINELSESIKEHGVIQPIVVRPVGDKYEIIAGERRYKASVLAGKVTIPAIVTDLNDKDSAEVALIENVQRQNLTPIEEAISYKKILDMGYLNQTSLAEKLGKNQSTIANKLRLLDLDDEVQEALLNSRISERHARSLLKLQNKENQISMLNRIINERMTVRKTDEEIDRMLTEESNNKSLNMNIENNEGESIQNQINVPFTQQDSSTLSFESLFSNNEVNPVKEATENPFMPTQESNISTTSLTNENSNVVQEQSIESIEFDTPINPGFMDIDKIIADAKPVVNQEEEKTVADMNVLMPNVTNLTSASENMPMSSNPSSIETIEYNDSLNLESTNNEQPFEPKKFFNILEEEQKENESNLNENATKFKFDNLFETPNVSEIPQPIETIELKNLEENQQVLSEINNMSTVENAIPEQMSQPYFQINNNTNRFEQAMLAIKECATKLESLGYKQEYDEFDLEDMYQVIFRIEQK